MITGFDAIYLSTHSFRVKLRSVSTMTNRSISILNLLFPPHQLYNLLPPLSSPSPHVIAPNSVPAISIDDAVDIVYVLFPVTVIDVDDVSGFGYIVRKLGAIG